ncbi:H-NS histone family protein [Paraburkholderia sp. CNPSo 3274]|uniref:H-NS family nucleoid-associated regulatory protein n=1 Tax=unclassified Paraburkholderia TaxID=2615204 RepID=UPI0020B6E274|nr:MULTISPECIES: H-NS family nucleoid-associated regulatory protein [unclassified Paraburkholderia]MCP3707174.1 H-NS histone family protein [Paraburkholderia sp. CNPSo 3274]MCP3715486.1 H-NS histone family protein [Paraburkholderia sp. CNPSo 3281]
MSKGKIVDEEARERLIIWLRRRMTEFGVTPEALAAAIEHDREHPPLFHDAHGNKWDGEGEKPGWLAAAERAGVDPAFFPIRPEQN